MQLKDYVNRIQQVYPDLTINKAELNTIGQNNDVLIVNRELVFKFPKYQAGIIDLQKESQLLNQIKGYVSLAVPSPEYESYEVLKPGHVFNGYSLIQGTPLWSKELNKADSQSQKMISDQLIQFLIDLHSIPTGELHLGTQDPYTDMLNLYRKIKEKLYPFMRTEAQSETSRMFDKFLSGGKLSNIKLALIHGDFGSSNILWNSEPKRVTGIIDFGGSGIGDLAYDLAGLLSSFGERFFNQCMSQYPDGEKIVERINFYRGTFALQEALHGLENNDPQAFDNGISRYR
ncbi:phosphotransferase family protein [Sporolactobacillus laevolacticus]|uniref:Aminoglycoside phosphotransferase n=1 Tax=Sporolactobacillus laevolacticus DSM 442 TaxID=1395513 RepID=V6J6Y1_9BACL|nr:aminoglycoside phosphotransferase family protein [Sporolactobacillus laevolacticus]EST12539.1 aminoglycoside phosphotransferase [Sporolactobacillus laevolacticus DSM 442]